MNVEYKDDELAGGKIPCCPVSDKHHLSASSEPRIYYCRECGERDNHGSGGRPCQCWNDE